MQLPEYVTEILEGADSACDEVVYLVKIISDPQICFPFPGESEINVIAQIIDEEAPPDHDSTIGECITMVLDRVTEIPKRGSKVYALHYVDFYEPVGHRLIPPDIMFGRFCYIEKPAEKS